MNDERVLVEARLEQLLAEYDPREHTKEEFLGARFDLGLAWVEFEAGLGGLGVDRGLQTVVDDRLAHTPTPWTNFIGVAQGARAIHTFGTRAQNERWLRPCFSNEEIWCQLFSEPGAGSDLAGLSTMAVRDGDEWVVNGQKVWTSYARQARWAILLARTDPNVPKHRGLTFFVCDMSLPGVDVRPLRQADGTDHHFNEVFLDEVHLPDGLRIGDVGQGWAVSVAGLSAEREGQGHLETPIDDLIAQWQQQRGRLTVTEPVVQDRLVSLYIRSCVNRWTVDRIRETRRDEPGNEGAMTKVAHTELLQDMANMSLELLGPEGQLGGEYALMLEEHVENPQLGAIRSRAASIEGGTNQILRNIIGERILGLPGDVRVDKTLPWNEVPR
jgi:alkylation response protein AidB-like acyl-CoA dehydrogenase